MIIVKLEYFVMFIFYNLNFLVNMYKGTSGLCDYIFLYINVFMEYCANVI